MKKVVNLLVKKYRKLSGDTKVRIALNLSKTVRKVRKAGIVGTGV